MTNASQQPGDSFGGDWSVWGATLPDVSYNAQQQQQQQEEQHGSNGKSYNKQQQQSYSGHPVRFDPNAPPFLYSPTFSPYAMQAPLPSDFNPYDPSYGSPVSPYSPTGISPNAPSFTPRSPVMTLGQIPYGSYDVNSPTQGGFWPSFQGNNQQRRMSNSGWPQQFNAPGYSTGRRQSSVGRVGARMPGSASSGMGGSAGAGGVLGIKRGSVDSSYAPVLRSETLENFRNDKTRLWDLSEIQGHVVEFTSDQFASRWLQQKLETATEEERQWVFDEVLTAAFTIQTDVFGNYCIQKLLDFGTPEQKETLAKTMEGNVMPLSLSTYGCRSIQKALEVISTEQRNILVAELKDNIMDCVKSSNANHVIQRIVSLPEPALDFVQAFTGRVFELSTHPYGCRVLQRCFEFLPAEQSRPLLDEMHTQTRRLVLDQFGNYVIQFVIDKGLPEDRTRIIEEMKGQILQMARHKFASNVCEKAFVCAPREEREMLIEELLLKSEGAVALLMKDQFGNYVLQRALRVSEGEQKELLKARVQPHIEQMRTNGLPHSKHLASIERLLDDSLSATPTATPSPATTD